MLKCISENLILLYGGEEFIIGLLNTARQDAVHIAEKIRTEIQTKQVEVYGKEITLTLSWVFPLVLYKTVKLQTVSLSKRLCMRPIGRYIQRKKTEGTVFVPLKNMR